MPASPQPLAERQLKLIEEMLAILGVMNVNVSKWHKLQALIAEYTLEIKERE